MSGTLRMAMGPIRKRLVDTIDAKPDLVYDFETTDARNNHLRILRAYKETLHTKAERFLSMYNKLVDQNYADAGEQKVVEELVQSDSEIVGKFDDVMAEINSIINEISSQPIPFQCDEMQSREQTFVTNRDQGNDSGWTSTRRSASVKLPRLELIKFNGEVLRWQEFWDCFRVAIHENQAIQSIDKMNYLKAQLTGEARMAISCLAATSNNYEIAVRVLEERFGKKQQVIDAHYTALSDLNPATNHTSKLRSLVDTIDSHLHSLEALGENVNHRHFISMMRAKLPPEVIFRLEETRGEHDWDVNTLRERLRQYLSARELADGNLSSLAAKSRGESYSQKSNKFSASQTTTGALLADANTKVNYNGTGQNCAFCEGGHWSDQCRTYVSVDERKRKLRDRCFKCLKSGHMVSDCQRTKPCFYCKDERHHSSLCRKKFGNSSVSTLDGGNGITAAESDTTTTTQSISEGSLLASGESVLLQTARTTVCTTRNNSTMSRVLLDTGSHRSYISEALMERLKLKPKSRVKLSVFTFGSLPPKEITTSVVEVNMKLLDGSFFGLSANVVPTITGGVQRMPVDFASFGALCKNLPFADSIPHQAERVTVDILIGSDYYWELVTSEKIEMSKGLYLIGSKLGWILCGRYVSMEAPHASSTVLFSNAFLCPDLPTSFAEPDPPLMQGFDLKAFWDLDTIGIRERADTVSDEDALQTFNDTVRYVDNRYFVKWPWKRGDIDLPSNFELSLGRLNSMLRRHKNDSTFFESYQSVIQNQLKLGIIEKVCPSGGTGGRKHYIPHHAVITPGKATTTMRIVYDGSAKSRKDNLSINECMHRGSVMLEDVGALLIRFRLNKVAIVADIEKAFLQIGLQQEDRDVTRFLWLRDPTLLSTDNNLQVFRFMRVPFGIISSPFLLAATIAYHLKRDGSDVGTNILRNIYVDNIITGVDSCALAMNFYSRAKELFSSASMNVREWASNSMEFINSVPVQDRASNTVLKVLGVVWNTTTDELSISVPTMTFDNVTKRTILKFVASIFDPLGMFSPTVLLAKLFLQKLWCEKLAWDDTLSPEFTAEWTELVHELMPLASFNLGRYMGGSSHVRECELHCFCDASQTAYGTCVYLRVIGLDSVSVDLVFSKSRLAPIEKITLPRLELLAVHIGSRCLDFVLRSLPFTIMRKFIWTDSQCVLHWMESAKPLPIFVRNRVADIRKVAGVQLRYVPTSENPADLASRGKSAVELISCDIWWHGPTWLVERGQRAWPSMDFMAKTDHLNDEDKSVLFSVATLASEDAKARKCDMEPPFGIDLTRYSSFTKLLRVTAWAVRFISRLKGKMFPTECLSAEEVYNAKNHWINFVQRKYFECIFAAIKDNRRHPVKEQFDLWVDGKGTLRCGGRLSNAELSEFAMHPILLPKGDHFTRLIIRNFHDKLFHAGVSHTLAQVRHEFWIPSGRSEVAKSIRSCPKCRRHDGGPYKLPEMPSLPKSRVTPATPFQATGLDYFGPLYVKTKNNSQMSAGKKVWVCLFTCLCTRAVHLEVVEDMSADEFLLCLQRFIARRGKPDMIVSDNAPQFKLVSSTVAKLWQRVIISELIANYVSDKNIHWKFIVERAPWMGGYYERLVQVIKQCLRKSIGSICLSLVQLQTVVVEIEAVINSRPLAYVGADFCTGQLISPGNFLSLNSHTGPPPFDLDQLKDSDYIMNMSSKDRLINNWKAGHRHLEHFWKVWRDHYLISLRERPQRHVKQPVHCSSVLPKTGDVVHVRADGPRGTWKLARITNLVTSKDGKIRSAEIITTKGNKMYRSLAHLYPLECDGHFGDDNGLIRNAVQHKDDCGDAGREQVA